MNYYNFHIGDYRRDTTHLSMLEHGAYRQLLDMYYLNETPIPTETQVVIRRLSARTQDEVNAVEIVLKEFFIETPDGYVHKRCDADIAQYQAKADVNKVNGKLGGRPKKTQVVIDGLIIETKSEPKITLTNNQEPLTNNHIKNIAPIALLMAMGISKELATDWLKVRKEKKAAPTQTAFNAIKKHAEDNGYTFAQAIQISCERNWASFKVSWLQETLTREQSITSAANSVFKDKYIREQTQSIVEGEYAKLN